MRHPDDAIRWIDTEIAKDIMCLTTDLGPVIDMEFANEQANFVTYDAGDGLYEPRVGSVRNLRPQLELIHAQGPLAFHVDTTFPRYTYLMILRDGGLMVEGGAWLPFSVTLPGTLVCLDVHRNHGLRTAYYDDPAQMQSAEDIDAPYEKGWAALALNFWAEVPPLLARQAFAAALLHDESAILEQAMHT